jgi:hypothetical protein
MVAQLLVGDGQHRAQVLASNRERWRVEHAKQQVGDCGGYGRGGQCAQPRLAQSGRPEVSGLSERHPCHVGEHGARGARVGPAAPARLGTGGAPRTGPVLSSRAQRGEQCVAVPATPGEHRERIVVECLGKHITHRGEVLARQPALHLPPLRGGQRQHADRHLRTVLAWRFGRVMRPGKFG